MSIRKEKEEICGRLSTRVVYITEDGKRFCQESEAFLHDEYLKWQQTARKMGVKCIDGGYYCKNEQALAAVVIMISYKTGLYDWKQKKFVNPPRLIRFREYRRGFQTPHELSFMPATLGRSGFLTTDTAQTQ